MEVIDINGRKRNVQSIKRITQQIPDAINEKKQYMREWGMKYRKNPEVRERIKKNNRDYARRPEVKEKRKKYSKEWRLRPEVQRHRKLYSKAYYAKHREHIRELRRNWDENHPEEIKKRRLKYRDKDNTRRRNHYKELRFKVLEKLGGKCVYCGCNNPDALEINHINGIINDKECQSKCYAVYKKILTSTYSEPVELTCKICNAVHYLKMKGITGFEVIWNDKRD